MDTNYLIIPGFGNSGPEHWQAHFLKELPNSSRIEQKSWDNPLCEDWVNTIHETVKQFDPETVVLISHSLGGIAIAHWAKQFNVKIKGAMLVAPPDIDHPFQDLSLESFTPIPIEKLPFPSVIVASTNDNWSSQVRSQIFADNWGSALVFIGDAGHINATSGFGKWNEGLDILKKYVD